MLNILKIAFVSVAIISAAGAASAGDGQDYPDTLIHWEEMSTTGSF